jgi:hypothetical protein
MADPVAVRTPDLAFSDLSQQPVEAPAAIDRACNTTTLVFSVTVVEVHRHWCVLRPTVSARDRLCFKDCGAVSCFDPRPRGFVLLLNYLGVGRPSALHVHAARGAHLLKVARTVPPLSRAIYLAPAVAMRSASLFRERRHDPVLVDGVLRDEVRDGDRPLWPMRWMRSCACALCAGFQSGRA